MLNKFHCPEFDTNSTSTWWWPLTSVKRDAGVLLEMITGTRIIFLILCQSTYLVLQCTACNGADFMQQLFTMWHVRPRYTVISVLFLTLVNERFVDQSKLWSWHGDLITDCALNHMTSCWTHFVQNAEVYCHVSITVLQIISVIDHDNAHPIIHGIYHITKVQFIFEHIYCLCVNRVTS
jgi:hypothetical protein